MGKSLRLMSIFCLHSIIVDIANFETQDDVSFYGTKNFKIM
jgi:hypothetical protein